MNLSRTSLSDVPFPGLGPNAEFPAWKIENPVGEKANFRLEEILKHDTIVHIYHNNRTGLSNSLLLCAVCGDIELSKSVPRPGGRRGERG